ncbi:hypothetical protein OIY81_977 [Cryptosporidium canis]|uniref:BZIP domain-containing protein n=1 Tax=Cryptosporidium canis TaxID=195482 RepID=A0ABQ8P5X3_9CRYT|nr:hypothetical protein OJ252_2355 [Cryptosporidium canis]KAJ1613403.1 hypothetical protein OIY81_977 [Cryptosporidium canis]
MVNYKKKFRKISLETGYSDWNDESLSTNIGESLSSGNLFTLDSGILSSLRNGLSLDKGNSKTTSGKIGRRCISNKTCAVNNIYERSSKNINKISNNDLDIWGESINNLEVKSNCYPGEILRIKGPSIQLPHSGQSVNPLESDRQDAIFMSASISNTLTSDKLNKTNLASSVDSFISNFYEPEELLKLTDTQKYVLVKYLLNGEILKPDSDQYLETDQSVHSEGDKDLDFRKKNFGLRKKRSLVNRENRRKREILVMEEGEKIKKLNKDVQNIGKFSTSLYYIYMALDVVIRGIDETFCQLENRRAYLSILKEQLDSARKFGILSNMKVGRNAYKIAPLLTLSGADVSTSDGSLRKLHLGDTPLSKDIISNVYRRGLTEIPPINDSRYGRRLKKLLRRNMRSRKIAKRHRFFN